MKYFVDVGGREITVEIAGDRVVVDGRSYHVTLQPVGGTPLRQLTVDGRPRLLAVQPVARGRWLFGAAGERRELEVIDERTRHIRSLTAQTTASAGSGVLKAPMPGLVVRIQVEPGAAVQSGTGVLVLEAMKMENELRAAGPGVVRAVRVQPGQAVEKGQVLVEFDAP
ncbi:MAG TPA: biotin/lipoyl-containing protein [Gemmatimonadales bacterium]|nr:biotin/lipoyl-containing protein [Gemmatimonadales bacterium]